ncbi:hypothetical protein [Streptomyces sp. NPDC055036]
MATPTSQPEHGWATPFRIHLADGRVWHGVEFQTGYVCVHHPDEPNGWTIAVSVDGLLADHPECAPLHGARVERKES